MNSCDMAESVIKKRDFADTQGEVDNSSGNALVKVKLEKEDDGVLVTYGIRKRKRLSRSPWSSSGHESKRFLERTEYSSESLKNKEARVKTERFEDQTLAEFIKEESDLLERPRGFRTVEQTKFTFGDQRKEHPGMMTRWNTQRVKCEEQTLAELKREKCGSIGTPVPRVEVRTIAQKKTSLECQKNRQRELRTRWNTERFQKAEESLAEILKENGASFETPIQRGQLRMIARKTIGDTGLLDHLLKHVDGNVTPNGADRFRRCYNTEGIMQYWLESADLVKIKRESGVVDPAWVPPYWWKVKGEPEESSEPFQEENEKLRSVIKELESKQKLQDEANAAEKLYKELMTWRVKTEKQIEEISNSLTSTQCMFKELIAWKDDVEQKLVVVSNSLNNLQTNGSTSFSPAAESWETILQTANLDDFAGNGFEPWDADIIDVLPGAVMPDMYSLPVIPSKSTFPNHIWLEDQSLINVEMQKTEREEQSLISTEMQKSESCMTRGDSRSSNQDKADMTPGSSVTAGSSVSPGSDIDDPDILSQGTLKELVTWKGKAEQQLTEILTAVLALQGQSQTNWVFP